MKYQKENLKEITHACINDCLNIACKETEKNIFICWINYLVNENPLIRIKSLTEKIIGDHVQRSGKYQGYVTESQRNTDLELILLKILSTWKPDVKYKKKSSLYKPSNSKELNHKDY